MAFLTWQQLWPSIILYLKYNHREDHSLLCLLITSVKIWGSKFILGWMLWYMASITISWPKDHRLTYYHVGHNVHANPIFGGGIL
jgi:hypothetical protein